MLCAVRHIRYGRLRRSNQPLANKGQFSFQTVDVIDDDLGIYASGSAARPGFERLVAALCSGEVGAVFCLEVSRLARPSRDIAAQCTAGQ
jgi:DNA invertase Pin-like site-specific DNA recombinase